MNETQNTAFKKITAPHFLRLEFLGLFLLKTTVVQILLWLKKYFFGFYCHIMNLYYNTMFLGYGIRMIYKQTPLNVDYLSEVMVVQCHCFRYLLLYLRRQDLKNLIKSCKGMWSYLRLNEEENITIFQKKVIFLRTSFLGILMSNVTLYMLTPFAVRFFAEDTNETTTKTLPYKYYVDIQDDFWYKVTVGLQALMCYSITVIMTGIEVVAPFFIMMACGFLRIIQIRLLNMSKLPQERKKSLTNYNSSVNQLSHHEVRICVKFHQQTMEFCAKIEEFSRYVFLVQVLGTVYNMSMIGIKLLKNDSEQFIYIFTFLLNLLQFFTCQWISEHLLNEGEGIFNASYVAALAHPNYERNANRMLFFMMLRTQKPLLLTAGGYVNLCLETFQHMVVSAFSFFTVLQTTVT